MPQVTNVQAAACRALHNLLTSPEGKAAAASTGCVERVLLAMDTHQRSAELQVCARAAQG